MLLRRLSICWLFTASLAMAEPCKQLCNFTTELSTIQKTPAQALVVMSEMTNRLAGSENTSDLKNLLSFCAQVRPVLVAARVDANALNAVSTLEKMANLGLAKFTTEIQADVLFGYFSKLPDVDETSRLEVIQKWVDRLQDVENRKELGELATFFSKAGDLCERNEDSIFVIKAARDAEQSAITKSFQLNPFYEGEYAAIVTCGVDDSEACPTDLFDRIVILDTFSLENIQLTAINSKLGVSVFNFTQIKVTQGGKTFDALSRTNGASALAKLHLDYQASLKGWEGTITTTDREYHVRAIPLDGGLFTKVFDMQATRPLKTPLNDSLFDTLWTGIFGKVKNAMMRTSLYQVSTPTDLEKREIGATMRFKDVDGYKFDFQWGRVFKKTGIISIVGSQADGGYLKMVLAGQPSQSGKSVIFSGFSLSSMNGKLNSVVFEAPIGDSQ